MNKSAKFIKRCASLCIAATMFLLPVKAWALDLNLGDGAIIFGGDSSAGATTYSQGSNANVPYTDTANVTGDYSGPDTAITVSGGNHTIVVDGANITSDSAAPAISITGGEQDVTLTDTYINAGDNGPGVVINGGDHTVTMDDFAVNGNGDAGIAIAGSALTGDGTGSLAVPEGSGATVKATVRGEQAPVQGVELVGRVRTTTETTDGVEQTVTTITARRAADGGGFGVRIEYLGDGRFQINIKEAPIRVEMDGKEVEFTFEDGILTVLNMPEGVLSMVVTWENF